MDGRSLERADGDSLNPGYDPHDIVAVPTDWPFV